MQDIGKLISDELIRQERTPAWLASKLGCDRTNAYKILKRSSIDTSLLARISIVLKHDFFLDLSAELNLQGDKGVTAYRGISADCK